MPQIPVRDAVAVHVAKLLEEPAGLSRVALLLNRHVEPQQADVMRENGAGSPHQRLESVHVKGRPPEHIEEPVVVAQALDPVEIVRREQAHALRLQRPVVPQPVLLRRRDHVHICMRLKLLDDPPAVGRHPGPLRRPGRDHRHPLPRACPDRIGTGRRGRARSPPESGAPRAPRCRARRAGASARAGIPARPGSAGPARDSPRSLPGRRGRRSPRGRRESPGSSSSGSPRPALRRTWPPGSANQRPHRARGRGRGRSCGRGPPARGPLRSR